MIVKATTNFSGTVTMNMGQTKNLDEGPALNDLLQCGYVIPAEEGQKSPKAKKNSKDKADEAE